MLLFRFLCAIFMAWAINVAFGRPEATLLIEEVPELAVIGPVAAAFVGFVNLAKRQGWGIVVAIANGTWAGILTLFTMVLVYLAVVEVLANMRAIGDYEDLVRIFGSAAEPLFERLVNVPLLTVIVAATAMVGILTEILHWCLVRLRRDGLHAED